MYHAKISVADIVLILCDFFVEIKSVYDVLVIDHCSSHLTSADGCDTYFVSFMEIPRPYIFVV